MYRSTDGGQDVPAVQGRAGRRRLPPALDRPGRSAPHDRRQRPGRGRHRRRRRRRGAPGTTSRPPSSTTSRPTTGFRTGSTARSRTAAPRRRRRAPTTPRSRSATGGRSPSAARTDTSRPIPPDPDIVFGGGVSRFDWKTLQEQNVDPTLAYPGDYRGEWTLPLAFSPRDPSALYFGNQFVFRTTDGGRHWEKISPDLTREAPGVPANLDPATAADSADARPAARRDLRDRAVAARGRPRLVRHRRRPDLADARRRRALGERHAAGADAVVEGRRHRGVALRRGHRLRRDRPAPARRPRRRTSTGRATAARRWTSIAHGIPAGSFVNVVREDPERRGLLYAGTETGVFVSFDDGEHWQSLQANLPNCSIRDIDVRHGDLVVATHGRSFWVLDDLSPLRQLDAKAAAATAWLFAPRDGGAPESGGVPGHARAEGRAGGREPAARRDPRLRPEGGVAGAGRPRDPRRERRARPPLRERRREASRRTCRRSRSPRTGSRSPSRPRPRRACTASSGTCATRRAEELGRARRRARAGVWAPPGPLHRAPDRGGQTLDAAARGREGPAPAGVRRRTSSASSSSRAASRPSASASRRPSPPPSPCANSRPPSPEGPRAARRRRCPPSARRWTRPPAPRSAPKSSTT